MLFGDAKYEQYELSDFGNFYVNADVKKDENKGIFQDNPDLKIFNISRDTVSEIIKPYYRLDVVFGKVHKDETLFFRCNENYLPFVDIYLGYPIDYFVSETRDFLLNFVENNKVVANEFGNLGIQSGFKGEDIIFFEERINSFTGYKYTDKIRGFLTTNGKVIYFRIPEFMRKTIRSLNVSRKLVKVDPNKKKKLSVSSHTHKEGEDFDIEVANYPFELNITFSYPVNMFYRFSDQFSSSGLILPPFPFLRYTHGQPTKIVVVYGYMNFGYYEKKLRTVFLHKYKLSSKQDFQDLSEGFFRETSDLKGIKSLNPCEEFFNASFGNFSDFIKLNLMDREDLLVLSEEGSDTDETNTNSESSEKVNITEVEKKLKKEDGADVSTCVQFAIQPYLDFFMPDKRFYFTVAPVSVAFAGYIDKVNFKGSKDGIIELIYNCVSLKDFSSKENPIRGDLSYKDLEINPKEDIPEKVVAKTVDSEVSIDVKKDNDGLIKQVVHNKIKRVVEEYYIKEVGSTLNAKTGNLSNSTGSDLGTSSFSSKKFFKYRDETIGTFILRILISAYLKKSLYFSKSDTNLFDSSIMSARKSMFYYNLDFNKNISYDFDSIDKRMTFSLGPFIYTFRSFFMEDSIKNYFQQPSIVILSEYDFDYYISLVKYFIQIKDSSFYGKNYLTFQELISQLKKEGITISDESCILYYKNKNFFGYDKLQVKMRKLLDNTIENKQIEGHIGRFYIKEEDDENVVKFVLWNDSMISDLDNFIYIDIDKQTGFLSVFGMLRGKGISDQEFQQKNFDFYDFTVGTTFSSEKVFNLYGIYSLIPSDKKQSFLDNLDKFYKDLVIDGFSLKSVSEKDSYRKLGFQFNFVLANGEDQETHSMEFNDGGSGTIDISNPFSAHILSKSTSPKLEFDDAGFNENDPLNLFYSYQNIHLAFSMMLNLGDIYIINTDDPENSQLSNSDVLLGGIYDKLNPKSSKVDLKKGQKLRFISSIYIDDDNFSKYNDLSVPIIFINIQSYLKGFLRDAMTDSKVKILGKIIDFLYQGGDVSRLKQISLIGTVYTNQKGSIDITDLIQEEMYLDCVIFSNIVKNSYESTKEGSSNKSDIELEHIELIIISNFVKLINVNGDKMYLYDISEKFSTNKSSEVFKDKIVLVDEFSGLEGVFQSYFRLTNKISAVVSEKDGISGIIETIASIIETTFDGIVIEEKDILSTFEYKLNLTDNKKLECKIYYIDLKDVIRNIEGTPFTDFDEYMLEVSNEDVGKVNNGRVDFDKYGFVYPIRKFSDLFYSIIPTIDEYKGSPILSKIYNVIFKNNKDDKIPSSLVQYYKTIITSKYSEKVIKAFFSTKKIIKKQEATKEKVLPVRFITVPVKEVPAIYLEYGEEVLEFSFDFNAGESGKAGTVKNIEVAKSFFAQLELDKEAMRRYWEERREQGETRNKIFMDIFMMGRQNPIELIRRFSRLLFRYNYKEGEKIVEPGEPGTSKMYRLELKLKYAIPGLRPGIYIWFDEKPVLFGKNKFRISVPSQLKGAYMVSEVNEVLLTDEGIIQQSLVCVR